MIIREFACGDCGCKFESSDPVEEVICPKCSSEDAERAFFTPPGIKQPQTARKDEIQRDLSTTYGLADMSNKDGGSVMQNRKSVPEAAQGQWGGDMGQVISKLGKNSDGFSPVLPALRQMGGPRTWNKVPDRK